MITTHVLQPVRQAALSSFDFNGQLLAPRTKLWNPDTENRIGRWLFGIDVVSKIAHRNHAEALVFEESHVSSELFWRRVAPWVCHIRHAMELKNDDATIRCQRCRPLEVLERPTRIGNSG